MKTLILNLLEYVKTKKESDYFPLCDPAGMSNIY
jgi:hypothetical protein